MKVCMLDHLIPNMFGVLLSARTYKYLVISDVQKYFHHIRVQESERDATRIIWVINYP